MSNPETAAGQMPSRDGGRPENWRVTPLAPDPVIVAESPDPARVFLGTPTLITLPSGRLVAGHDFFGPGVADLPGPKGLRPHYGQTLQGCILTSDDDGATWTPRHRFPFFHARLFSTDDAVYLIGHCGKIMIIRSDDEGSTWSEPVFLTEYDAFTQTAANVWQTDQHIYLVMMKIDNPAYPGYFISELSPVLMRCRCDVDALNPENWTFSEPAPTFRELVPDETLEFGGFPFFKPTCRTGGKYTEGERSESIFDIGWSEAGVVRITDPDHYWYDPEGRTYHIFLRFENHLSNYAAAALFREHDDGTIRFDLQYAPSGKKMVVLPMPGGQMRFHIVYDEIQKLYWLISTQSTDSMTRLGSLPNGRFQLPYNERQRLQLHFSRNMVDWCFAGLIDAGTLSGCSRHYCSAVIKGNDMLVLSRSGDGLQNPNPHDTNLVTLHRIGRFRELVY